MIFLDTHAAVFLHESKDKIPRRTWKLLENVDCVLSPMARLEVEFLHEIGRIRHEPMVLFESLARDLAVTIALGAVTSF